MIIFSRAAEFRQVLSASRYSHMKVQGKDEVEKVPEWGTTIQFKPLRGQGIALKGKLWRGKFDTAEDLKVLQRVHPEINEQEIVTALMQHPNYGREFIAFGEDGGEAFEDEAFLEAVGDGSYVCHACDQVLKNRQGIPGHFGSDKHKSNKASYTEGVRKKFRL